MKIQPLEQRAKETAGRHPGYADQIARAVPFALQIEREVFAGLPFAPADLAAHVELPH
jgi:hypothetical protein